MKKSEALAILIGTQIGAGVLGLPYAASEVGLIPALAVLIGVMLLMLFTAYIVLDLSAKMNGAQMSTIAQRVLGKPGGWIMLISIAIMSFGALLAYISGMGEVLNGLFGINDRLGAVLFWLFASLIVYAGIEMSGKSELAMSLAMLVLFLLVAILLLPKGDIHRAMYFNREGLWKIIGVSIFALGCHSIIPDVYKSLGNYKDMKRVVLLAFLIPTAVYALFMVSFLIVFGRETPQIATQALASLYGDFGNVIGNLIPFFAITTSYIGIALAQLSNLQEFLKLPRNVAFVLTVVPPLIVYLLGIGDFVSVLGVAGDTGDLMAFIVLPIVIYITTRLLPVGSGEAEAT
ncbi:amino acid permease [Thermococcus chitonophagus]|uniref:Amino acid permease n=1 Tax=Thermococcus chitonophagus TaxID=54262 RepID=A0A160VSJ9_9EURY|nr:aromatic amino acid transport family protein [Thermococcus chitonophagus]ASJ16659.1 amino acid permease [Thermococcus chitonophagus]CUX77416.1 Tyrosine-specific transport protein [Thermococcus chitonophagus]